MTTNKTFWQSVLGAKKAIISGLFVFAAFVGATLNAAPNHHLTLTEWIIAVGAWAATHGLVYSVTNEAPAAVAPVAVPAGPAIQAVVDPAADPAAVPSV